MTTLDLAMAKGMVKEAEEVMVEAEDSILDEHSIYIYKNQSIISNIKINTNIF